MPFRVGVLASACAPDLDLRVWLEAPAPVRRGRALDRDGEVFAPHWQEWADQERALFHSGAPPADVASLDDLDLGDRRGAVTGPAHVAERRRVVLTARGKTERHGRVGRVQQRQGVERRQTVEVGLARGKKSYDKRQDLATRDAGPVRASLPRDEYPRPQLQRRPPEPRVPPEATARVQ